MLPNLSMAMLPIQRNDESGANVDCWKIAGEAVFGLRISYQRTPENGFLLPVPTRTECVTTSLSTPPMLRYASLNISRSASESSCCRVSTWGTQVPPLQADVYAATGMVNGPVSVVLAVFAQSTWNRHRLSRFVPLETR